MLNNKTLNQAIINKGSMHALFTIVATIGILASLNGIVEASNELNADKAVRSCMGEAEGESQTGKIAMMEALRNRGTLKGVYGYKAIKLVDGKYYKKVLKTGKYYKRTGKPYRQISDVNVIACRAAWVDSKYTNYVKGADHWEAVQTFGRPKWAHNMKQTAKIGNHTFFKSLTKG